MRIAIFLVYLCSLLLRLGGHIHADTQQKAIRYALTRSSEKGSSEENAHVCAPDADNDQEYILADSEDNEDDRFSDAAHYTIPYTSTSRPYQSILLYLYNSFKAPPSFYGPVSYIYIEQGVLRL